MPAKPYTNIVGLRVFGDPTTKGRALVLGLPETLSEGLGFREFRVSGSRVGDFGIQVYGLGLRFRAQG